MSNARQSRILARSLVVERANEMLKLVDSRDAGLLERLRRDAIIEMKRWKSIVIKELAEQPDSTCSIAGTYSGNVTPAEIGIAHSFSRRRANFTALHEFGHHLQQITPELVAQLGEQPDFGRVLEELASDVFAARVLLPEELVRKHLGAGTPTAAQIVSLYEAGQASRPAVCVAASQQLESPGMVMLVDDYGIIDFVASHMMEFPLRRGLGQGDAEILRARTQSSRTTVEARTRFSYAGGGKGESMYAQAALLPPFTLIVAVSDSAPWERLSLSSTEARFVPRWHNCEHCEYLFRALQETRCEICMQPKCPRCDWCACRARSKTKVCIECFLEKSTVLFDGESEVCQECAA